MPKTKKTTKKKSPAKAKTSTKKDTETKTKKNNTTSKASQSAKTKTQTDKSKTKKTNNGQASAKTKNEHLVWFTIMLVGVLYIFLFVGLMYIGSIENKLGRMNMIMENESRMVNDIHKEVVNEVPMPNNIRENNGR